MGDDDNSQPASRQTAQTVIGVDVGMNNLIVAVPHTLHANAANVLEIEGTVEYELINEFVEALDDHDNSDSDLAIQYEDLMVAHIDLAVDQLLDYTRMYPQPIIAVEDFGHSMPPGLNECVANGSDLSDWVIAKVIERIETGCNDAGIEVERVDHRLSSKTCGWCGNIGVRARSGVFHCNAPDCEITAVDGDRNAAKTIARRGAVERGLWME